MMWRSSVFLAFSLLAAPALGQTPGNVNDCTLIQDPVELRNCILRFEGNRTPPPVTLETPATGDAPRPAGAGLTPVQSQEESGSTRLPEPDAVRRADRNPRPTSSGPGGVQAQPLARPTARDTLISIEQVEIPRRGR